MLLLHRFVPNRLRVRVRTCHVMFGSADSHKVRHRREQLAPHGTVWQSVPFRRTGPALDLVLLMTAEQSRNTVLLVEDDQELASMVCEFLTSRGFDVVVEARGDAAADRIRSEPPDAVILDINLPGMDGITVCRTVRSDFHGVILMLTARGEERDEVSCLEVGADDYMAKPVRPRALLARLEAHLRRSAAHSADQPEPTLQVGSLVVDPSRRLVLLEAEELNLTTAEFEMLYLLAQHAGQPLSRAAIFERLHGMRYDGLDRSIDLRISRLRRKLGDDPASPERIKSVRGVGYLLSAER
jgi:DNA-binding response OmpR family regulator